MTSGVSYEVVEPGISLITLARAERMNALNEAVIRGLNEAWRRFEASEERVAIVHADGDRAFSVGAAMRASKSSLA